MHFSKLEGSSKARIHGKSRTFGCGCTVGKSIASFMSSLSSGVRKRFLSKQRTSRCNFSPCSRSFELRVPSGKGSTPPSSRRWNSGRGSLRAVFSRPRESVPSRPGTVPDSTVSMRRAAQADSVRLRQGKRRRACAPPLHGLKRDFADSQPNCREGSPEIRRNSSEFWIIAATSVFPRSMFKARFLTESYIFLEYKCRF